MLASCPVPGSPFLMVDEVASLFHVREAFETSAQLTLVRAE